MKDDNPLRKDKINVAIGSIITVAIFELLLYYSLLPSISSNFVSTLVSLMPSLGYGGLILILFLENSSVPLPGELFLVLSGYYVFVGRMSFLAVLTASSVASLIGGLLLFVVTLRFGAPHAYWWLTKLGVGQSTIARNELRLCGKYASALVIVSRFIPVFRSTMIVSAGGLRKNPLKFASLCFAGSLGSTAAYSLFGYLLGPTLLLNEEYFTVIAIKYCVFALFAVSLIYVAYFLLRWLRKIRKESTFVRKIVTMEERNVVVPSH